jgi:group I intron endonuclease
VSGDKRQRLSGDDSEILELEESEASPDVFDGDDTKCRTGCIYLITNPINGKVYVGKTLDYKGRMSGHKNSGKNPNQYFSRAIHKYGWENFTKEILIDEVPEEDLDNLEINYIAFYNSFNKEKGYNCTKGGGGTSGYKYTEEQLQAHIQLRTKNHDVDGGGSVSYCEKHQKWLTLACASTKKRHIGYYFTKERAIEALQIYNTSGRRMDSDVTIRRFGSGAIHEIITKNGIKRFKARYKDKYVGVYDTKEKAIQALGLYIQTGVCIPSDCLRPGKGSIVITVTKKGIKRFRAAYKHKYVGTFDTYEEADQALKIHIVNLKK